MKLFRGRKKYAVEILTASYNKEFSTFEWKYV